MFKSPHHDLLKLSRSARCRRTIVRLTCDWLNVSQETAQVQVEALRDIYRRALRNPLDILERLHGDYQKFEFRWDPRWVR